MVYLDEEQIEVYEKIAEKMNLPKEVVILAYYSCFSFIRSKLKELNLAEAMTEEEFDSLRTSFNIPRIGKLYTTYRHISGVKKRFNILKQIKKDGNKDKEN